MTIHKEGFKTLSIATVIGVILALTFYRSAPAIYPYVLAVLLILLGLLLQFFRHPKRSIPQLNDQLVYAPADGKVVVIEEAEESEYFKDKRMQVSIFMSPVNVHVNRYPFGGKVTYARYHPGKYLVAWHPKSSTENERSTVVLDQGKHKVLLRQIAGALARRIVTYAQQGQQVEQGGELGFIKFGSRVDIFLPLDSKIEVLKDQKVQGNKTVIAKLS